MLDSDCAPAGRPVEGEKEKENGGVAAAAGPVVHKPVPGRSRFSSHAEANPLATLNPRCAHSQPLFIPCRPCRLKGACHLQQDPDLISHAPPYGIHVPGRFLT